MVLTFTNVSAEKELQRELATRDLTKIMYSSISHELRTPCNAITNGLELMFPMLPRICHGNYKICQTSLKFLMSLINDSLDFAQLQAGKFTMNFEPTNIREVVREVTQLIELQLRLKEVYLINSVTPRVPETFSMDAQRFKQVLINLLRNASKFTMEGYIHLRLRSAKLAVLKQSKLMGH